MESLPFKKRGGFPKNHKSRNQFLTSKPYYNYD